MLLGLYSLIHDPAFWDVLEAFLILLLEQTSLLTLSEKVNKRISQN